MSHRIFSRKQATQILDDLEAIVQNSSLTIPASVYIDLTHTIHRGRRLIEGLSEITVREYVDQGLTGGVWGDGTPVVNLHHVRGLLYQSDSGQHPAHARLYLNGGTDGHHSERR